MSTAVLNLALDDLSRGIQGTRPEGYARAACGREEALPTLRVALLYGEQLCLPASSNRLAVLSGRAWITFRGEDHVLEGGDCLELARPRDKAIISALGKEELFFELA